MHIYFDFISPAIIFFLSCVSFPCDFCLEKDCGDPGVPQNGNRSVTDNFVYGATINFTCNYGYIIHDSDNMVQITVNCLKTGSWSTPTPQCTGKNA